MRRVGHPLALFAIVFQLALLFGHHHFNLSDADWLGNEPAASGPLQTGQAAPTPSGSRQDQAPATPTHGPCFVCMAIHAAAFLDVGAPLLVLPIAYERQPVSRPTVASILPPLRVAAFDSRGPPRG